MSIEVDADTLAEMVRAVNELGELAELGVRKIALPGVMPDQESFLRTLQSDVMPHFAS